MHDDELALQAARGDRDAMEQLVRRHYDELYAFAVRRTGSVQAAQDIAQATFEKAVRALARYRPQGRFRPWLFAIAVNTVRDQWRRRPDEAQLSDDLPAPGDLEQAMVSRDEYLRLRRCVQDLPESQRDALILYYYHDMSLKETARITGANLNTVKSRLRLAVEKLRSAWKENADEG